MVHVQRVLQRLNLYDNVIDFSVFKKTSDPEHVGSDYAHAAVTNLDIKYV